MSYEQLDHFADLFDPLLILALIGAAFRFIKGAPWSFLLRSGLAIIAAQQISKWVQKRDFFSLGHHFPSTHFAVTLVLVVGFWFLNRKCGLAASAATIFYAILMLAQHYHTPLEMLGAFFAVPIALVFHCWPLKARRVAN